MMGEHDENSIQTNIESFYNLDKLLNEFEKKRSFIKPSTRQADNSFENEGEIKSLYKSPKMVERTNKNQGFLHTVTTPKFNNPLDELEQNEEKFENALKEEKNNRKNPLKLLEIFIKRIQRLCSKLEQVRIPLLSISTKSRIINRFK